jgi:hypothetical protein
MPVYKLQGPDGKIYKIEGPEGATAEQLGQFILSQSQTRENKAAAQLEADRKLYDPTQGMSGTEKFLAGTGKAFADIGRGVSQYLPGGATREDVAESRQRDAALMNTGAGMAGNIAGNVAAAIPTAFIPGANTITGAGLIGAGMGAMQPSTSSGETLKNIGIGGVSSAAVPAAVLGGRVLKSFADPLYQGGRNQIMGQALRKAAGNQSDDAIKALQSSASIIPGVQYTAAEAAQNPGIAAMQRTATAADPVAMNEIAARQMSNNEALVSALKGVAPDRAAAQAARESATAPLYKQAYGETIQQTPELAALMQRPSMSGALGRGQSLAKEQGLPLTVSGGTPAQPSAILGPNGLPVSMTPAVPASMTGRDAHLIKMGLDDMANATPMTGIGGNELRAIQGTRANFLDEIEKQIPAYGQARQAYAAGSRPINQADVVEKIAGSATNFRGNLTPAAYARALSDKTAQGVTGQKTATLSKVMEPEQLKTLSAIGEDLGRADFANTAGRGAGSDTVQKLAFSNMLDAAGVPSAVRSFAPAGIVGNVAQRAGQLVYKDANEKMAAQLAQALLNPKDAAALMESGMVTPKMIALMNGLRRGGAALGSSAPGLIQANQQ